MDLLSHATHVGYRRRLLVNRFAGKRRPSTGCPGDAASIAARIVHRVLAAIYLFPKLYYPDRQLMGLRLFSLMLPAIDGPPYPSAQMDLFALCSFGGLSGSPNWRCCLRRTSGGLKPNNLLPPGLVQFIQDFPKYPDRSAFPLWCRVKSPGNANAKCSLTPMRLTPRNIRNSISVF